MPNLVTTSYTEGQSFCQKTEPARPRPPSETAWRLAGTILFACCGPSKLTVRFLPYRRQLRFSRAPDTTAYLYRRGCPGRQQRARARVSEDNTREQPDHRSTAHEKRHASLPHALEGGETLTSFARPPHDQLRALPRQPAPGAPCSCTSRRQRRVVKGGCMGIDHFPLGGG